MSPHTITAVVRRWLGLNSRPPVRTCNPHDPNRFRPRVEQLEVRETPASLVNLEAGGDAYEGGTAGVVTVARVGDLEQGISVEVAASGTATAGSDYMTPITINFAPYQVTANVQVFPLQDGAQEPDETITYTLQPGTGYDVGANPSATITLYDDDTPSTVTISGMANLQEESSPGLFGVYRTGALHQQITVWFMTSGTAMPGMDYQSPMSVTFAPWSTEEYIIVTDLPDTLVEGTETLTYTVMTSGTGYVAGTPNSATIDVIDNDVYVAPTVSAYGLDDAIEGGASGLIRLVRHGDLSASFQVNYTLSGTATVGSDYAQPFMAWFMPDQKYLDISISAVADGVSEGTEDVTLTVTTGTGYGLADEFFASVSLFDAPPAAPPPGPVVGTGLFARYYNTPDLYDLNTARIDEQVAFKDLWGMNAPPGTTVGADDFSVMWVGKVMPKVTGNYTFHTFTDDGVRLWVNGALVIDKWNLQPEREHSSEQVLPLTAGVMYDIRMEYFDWKASAVAELRWSAPGQVKELIPKAQLFPIALDLDVNANGSIRDTIDGSNDYLPGYAGNMRMLSINNTFNDSVFNVQYMKLVLDGVGKTTNGGTVSKVVFKLPLVSALGGYASNKNAAEINTAGTATTPGTNEDYSFYGDRNTANLNQAREITITPLSDPLVAGGKMDDTTTWVNFFAKDYGGSGVVEAHVYVMVNGIEQLAYDPLRITVSRDTDINLGPDGQPNGTIGDGIADKWEIQMGKRWSTQYNVAPITTAAALATFAPNIDNELSDPDGVGALVKQGVLNAANPLDPGENGDAHTVLEEYRGYILDGGGLDGAGLNGHTGGHIRLDPARKEILIEVDRAAVVNNIPAGGLQGVMTKASGVFSNAARGAGIYMYYLFDEVALDLPKDKVDEPGERRDEWRKARDTVAARTAGAANLKTDFFHFIFVDENGATGGTGAVSKDDAANLDERGSMIAVSDMNSVVAQKGLNAAKFDEFLATTVAHEITHLLFERTNVGAFNDEEHTTNANGDANVEDAQDQTCLMYGDTTRSNCELASVRFFTVVQAELKVRKNQALVLNIYA